MSTADLGHAVWRKSSRSSASGSDCVEVAELVESVGVRDSKDQTGPVLLFTPYSWADFIGRVRDGSFDAR